MKLVNNNAMLYKWNYKGTEHPVVLLQVHYTAYNFLSN
jgi:hypothetical protein